MTEQAGPTDTPDTPTRPPQAMWRRPPGLMSLAVIAIPLVMLLWSGTYPGFLFVPAFLSVLALLACGVVWLIRLIGWENDEHRANGRRWIVAPVMVLATVVLLGFDVPLRARFELGRDDFEAIVADLPPRGGFDEWATLRVPESIGGFEISFAEQIGDIVILHEANGGFLDDVGFAYLPSGPDDRLDTGWFESPRFQHLGGDWYWFVASW